MFRSNLPPFYIANIGKDWIIYKQSSGMRISHRKIAIADSQKEAEDFIRKIITENHETFSSEKDVFNGSLYNFYHKFGFRGSLEEFIKFCSGIYVADEEPWEDFLFYPRRDSDYTSDLELIKGTRGSLHRSGID